MSRPTDHELAVEREIESNAALERIASGIERGVEVLERIAALVDRIPSTVQCPAHPRPFYRCRLAMGHQGDCIPGESE